MSRRTCVCLVACALLGQSAPSLATEVGKAPTPTGSNGHFQILAQDSGIWLPVGQLSFGAHLQSKTLELPERLLQQDPLKIMVVKGSGQAAHIDAVVFGGHAASVLGQSNLLLRDKLALKDNDVADAQLPLFLEYPAAAKGVLRMTARIEGRRLCEDPFLYPPKNLHRPMTTGSDFYRYALNSQRQHLSIDGRLGEVQHRLPFFKEFSRARSGHPSAYTYGWVSNDDEYLFVAIDFTGDNTTDGYKDYAKVFVRGARDLKTFVVSMAEQNWGQPGFTYTDKVGYQHKVYEFKIPLAELGALGDSLELAFAAYGTCSPCPDAGTPDTTPYDSGPPVPDALFEDQYFYYDFCYSTPCSVHLSGSVHPESTQRSGADLTIGYISAFPDGKTPHIWGGVASSFRHDGADIGPLYSGIMPHGIANNGQIVGEIYDYHDPHAFLITPEEGQYYKDENGDEINDLMTDLRTYGCAGCSVALAINSASQVIGHINKPKKKCGDNECTHDETCVSCQDDCGSCAVDCGDLDCDGAEDCYSCPYDCGQCDPAVCGDGQCHNNQENPYNCEQDCGPYDHAFHWYLGIVNELSSPFGVTRVTAINESGAVAGRRRFEDRGNETAFVWSGGGYTQITEDSSYACDINDKGQVVGFASKGGPYYAYVWLPMPDYGQASGMHWITSLRAGSPDCRYLSINNLGQIVGRLYSPEYRELGFLWLLEETWEMAPGVYFLTDLVRKNSSDEPVFFITRPNSINDNSQIVAHTHANFNPRERWIRLWRSDGLPADLPPPLDPGDEEPEAPEPVEIQSGEDGDPVDTSSGALVIREPNDLSLSGPLPIVFYRNYNSRQGLTPGVNFGPGWLHNYHWRLEEVDGEVTITRPSGLELIFAQDPDDPDIWHATGATSLHLMPSFDAFILGDPTNNRIYRFNTYGLLSHIEDGRGNVLTFTYSPTTKLQEVSDGAVAMALTYDGSGMVETVSDGQRTVTYTYTVNNRLSTVTNAAGKTKTYEYDAPGRITAVIFPEGNTPYRQTYNSAGVVTTQLDSMGNEQTFDYGVIPKITTVTNALGAQTLHTHNFRNQLLSITDDNGSTVGYAYNSHGRRIEVTNQAGAVRSTSYEESCGRLASVIEADGAQVNYTYTVTNPRVGIRFCHLQTMEYADHSTETFHYDDSGNVTAVVDRAGETWNYTFGEKGQMLTATSPLGATTSYVYGADNTLLSEQDHLGRLTQYVYDAAKRKAAVIATDGASVTFRHTADDRLLAVVDELGQTMTYDYNSNGYLAAVTDAMGNTTSYAYDSNDRLTAITDPVGENRMTYDAVGNLTAKIDGRGATTTYEHDNLGRITRVTNAGGDSWDHNYTANGWRSSTTDPLGGTTHYGRDAVGRQTEISTPGNRTTSLGYDVLGRLVRITDATGKVTTLQYDGHDDLLQLTVPGGLTATYGRNAIGLLTSVTDTAGETWHYVYDEVGNPAAMTDPLGNQTLFGVDQKDRIHTITYADGSTQTMEYDAADNLLRRLFSDGLDLLFETDANGNMTGANGLTLGYDAHDSVIASNGISLVRDQIGQVTQMTLAPGIVVQYSYNLRGLVTGVTDWLNRTTTLDYDALERLVSVQRPNGVTTTYSYDEDSRLVGITETGAAQLSSIVLNLDDAGRLLSADRELPLVETAGSHPLSYTVNAAGEVTEHSYDALGRLLADDLRTYEWDCASRLVAYEEGGQRVSFTYDAKGRFLSRTDAGGNREFVWNYGLDLPSISIVREAGADLRYYIHLPSGELLYSVEADGTAPRYYHFDELGHTQFLTDATGDMTDAYLYSPFGTVMDSFGSTDNPFTFTGQLGVYQEGDSGLFLMRQRAYDARVLRFVSRDFAMRLHPRTLNPYQYAAGDPMRYIDPTGEAEMPSKGETAQEVGNTVLNTAIGAADAEGSSRLADAQAMQAVNRLNNNFGDKMSNGTRIMQAQKSADRLMKAKKIQGRVNSAMKYAGYYKEYKKNGANGLAKKYLRDQVEDQIKKVGKFRGGSIGAGAIEIYKTREAIHAEKRDWMDNNQRALNTLDVQLKEIKRMYMKGIIGQEQAETMLRNASAAFDESLAGTAQRGEAGIVYQAFTGGVRALKNTFLP